MLIVTVLQMSERCDDTGRAVTLSEGLIDELRLMIEPVILGGGKTIFQDDGELRRLELVSTVTSGTGVHVCTYRPVAQA